MHAKPAETNPPYWNKESLTPCFGCLSCRDLPLCGGLRIERAAMSCLDFCRCEDPNACDKPCPRNTRMFVGRLLEVQGYELGNVPRVPAIEAQRLPLSVPILFQRNRRSDRLKSPAVAIRLKDLFSARTGQLKYESREALADHFLFDPAAQLVIVGVGEDKPIESYWEKARQCGFPGVLSKLKPTIVTAPNYSMFLNAVRWVDFHSMKRIAICWKEMVESGLSAALHVHGRTDRDYERWTEFVVARDEVRAIAFEFGTGAAIPARAKWHIEKLIRLGKATNSRLQLLIKGGWGYAAELTPYFSQVVLIDSSIFMKSVQRKMAAVKNKKLVWEDAMTLHRQGIDGILQHNTDISASLR